MKKKKLNSLKLNKQKVSQLEDKHGGLGVPATLKACLTDFCAIESVIICQPPVTQFCSVQCVTLDCTFIGC